MNPRRGAINTSLIGLVLLFVTIVISLIVVVRNILAIERPSKTVVRIAHWQLEAGYREAMQYTIEKYQAEHPGIQIQQMPVTEKVYAQWINTQLISNTAPDLIEMGMSSMANRDENIVKYFLPLGDEASKPNPYNKNTNLEALPWKETLVDGMRGGFKDNLQDYYSVPTTLWGMRLFVNTNLLKAATGSDKLPGSFEEFIHTCEQIRHYSATRPKSPGRIIPFVSCYAFDNFTGHYQVPFTAKFEKDVDLDLDGIMGTTECYRAYRLGIVNFDTPAIRAYFAATKRICDQMQKGFSSMDRQQATYTFVNGNAAFLWTGSWDASGTIGTANEHGIDVKLMPWPMPKPGDPYSEFIAGQPNEAASRGAGPYALFRYTPNREIALDFLRFLTSQKGNEEFNQRAGWPPIAIDAVPSKLMAPFMPDPVGYTSFFNLRMGSYVQSELNAKLLLYYQGERPLDTVVAAVEKAIVDPRIGGDRACWNDFNQKWRDCRNQDRLLAREAVEELMEPSAFDATQYRRTVLQQLRRNNGRDVQYLFEQFRGMPLPMF